MYDLPSESPEDPGLPDEFHDLQPQLLTRSLVLLGYLRSQWFTGSDLNLYYDLEHRQWYKRPDWFLALNVPRLYDGWDLRRSYVVWQEGQSPTIVVEFLSPNTEKEDLGRFYQDSDRIDLETMDPEPKRQFKTPSKLEVYEHYLKVPHYLVYSRYTQTLRYFKLVQDQYEEQRLESAPPLVWLEDLQLGLGLWQGPFEGVPGTWLRWCDQAGNWLLTDVEQADLARQQADLARQQADLARQQADLARQQADLARQQAEQKAQRLAQKLWELGIDPDQILR